MENHKPNIRVFRLKLAYSPYFDSENAQKSTKQTQISRKHKKVLSKKAKPKRQLTGGARSLEVPSKDRRLETQRLGLGARLLGLRSFEGEDLFLQRRV